MTNLLMIREWYRKVYSRYAIVIEIGIRFVISLVAVLMINANIGAMSLLNSPLVAAVAAVVCAVVPKSLMILLLAVLVLAHISSLSIELAGFILAVLIIMFLLYFRFSAGDSLVLVLVPVLFVLKVPFIVPVVMGLVATPFSIVSVAFGTLMYFILKYVHMNYDSIRQSTDGLGIMTDMAKEIFTNQTMYLIMIAFSITLIVVYMIHRLPVKYCWTIGVAAGSVTDLVILLIGNASFGMTDVFTVPALILGNIAAVLVGICVTFMKHNVDYHKTEQVQFEDDDYYYYVKAVPKLQVEQEERRGKKNSGRRAAR